MTIYTFDKDKVSDLREQLCLTVDWKKNTEHLKILLDKYSPFSEVAACWSQPGEFNYFTSEAETFFGGFFKDIKRVDMVQSKELVKMDNVLLPDTYVISIGLDETYLGMLLVHVVDSVEEDTLKLLVKSIIPQLSLARYATTMANEVEKRTSTDKLTGLWNRNYFNERFREECIRLQRTKEQGAVLIIALDELAAMEKVISKEEHERLIIEASNLVRKMVRKTDWIVYWDKHEILVYLTNTQPESSIDVIGRCINQLVNSHPLLTPVVGLCSTSENTSARALIQISARRLDLARKEQELHGKKCIVCYATKEGLKFVQLTPKNSDKKEENKN